MAPSRLFTKIYHTLPQESQRAFVEDHLAPLLDALPHRKANRIIRAIKRTQARHHDLPKLDLEEKKREMQLLVRMLEKDDKVAFSEERGNREEILAEAVHSLSSWMNKIWSVVYEHKVNYLQAHQCLIYALKSVMLLGDMPGVGDCKCLYGNMHVAVALRDKQRRTMKYFSFVGPQNLDRVALWIWRDLFLTMLVEEDGCEDRVKEMMLGIEEILGWQGLERMLRGGKRKLTPEDDRDDCSEEDTDEEEDMLCYYEGVGTSDEFDFDCDGEETCCCRLHAKYWPEIMNQEQKTLREIVKNRLMDIFRLTPDVELFSSISSVSGDTASRSLNQLFQILSSIEGNNADTLKAALIIRSSHYQYGKITELLETYYHYLLPNDFPALLHAVAVLAGSPNRQHALKYVEREMADVVEHIDAAIRSTFGHLAKDANKRDLSEILKLPSSSSDRATRIWGWADRCLTTTSEPLNPMAFAAVMMGLPVGPLPPPMDDAQFLALTDLDKPDPDLDDLREEFRPQLKLRFDAWCLFAQTMPAADSCGPILRRIYERIIELMPFFRASDIVPVMMNCIADRQSKGYVHDAMATLLTFCTTQRKKLASHDGRKRRRQKQAGAGPAAQTTSQLNSVDGAPSPTTNGPIFVLPHPFPQGNGPA